MFLLRKPISIILMPSSPSLIADGEGTWDLDIINESCPRWAREWEVEGETRIEIVDVKGMCEEVEALVDCMDSYMECQRERRLEKLRGLGGWRRRWYYIFAIPVFLTGAVMVRHRWGEIKDMMEKVMVKMNTFYIEHVKEPIDYLYTEFFTSKVRDKITDRAALEETRNALKRMLHTWHEDTYPNMKVEERVKRSDGMDVSLIEAEFEEGVTTKTIQNIITGDIVRMSLIEMQFLKKELLTAMGAIDDLMEANEFNIRVGSMVPAGVGIWFLRKVARGAYYMLVPGTRRSKRETHETLRAAVLDIERLLVMRDHPPPPPQRLQVGKYKERIRSGSVEKEPMVGLSFDDDGAGGGAGGTGVVKGEGEVTLNENDWGMVVLLLHEAQTLLWREQRRFNKREIPNLFEDLAEIAGERGPVSVKQQLQILGRMARTYEFLQLGGKEGMIS